LTQLHTIRVDGGFERQPELHHLQGLRKIAFSRKRTWNDHGTIRLRQEELEKFPLLEELDLSGCEYAMNIEQVSHLPRLKKLSLPNMPDTRSIDALASHPALEELRFPDTDDKLHHFRLPADFEERQEVLETHLRC